MKPQNLVRQAVDQLAVHLALKPPKHIRKRSVPENLDHNSRIDVLKRVNEIYEGFSDEDIFPTPKLTNIQNSKSQLYRDLFTYQDLSWHSRPAPLWKSEHLSWDLAGYGFDQKKSFQAKIDENHPNQKGRARWYRSAEKKPRAIVITLHGYAGGFFPIEERTWPTQQALRAGMDIVNLVLPYHGARRFPSEWVRPPKFPSSDQRFTIEGVRQAIHDFRVLKGYLNQRYPEVPIIATGMSLGGYCCSLLACLNDPPLAAIPSIPLACMVDLIERQNRFKGGPKEKTLEKQGVEFLFNTIDPTKRAPTIPKNQVDVIAGIDDRITGLSHADILVNHFGCKLHTFDGSHIFRIGFKNLLMEILCEKADQYWNEKYDYEKPTKDPRCSL